MNTLLSKIEYYISCLISLIFNSYRGRSSLNSTFVLEDHHAYNYGPVRLYTVSFKAWPWMNVADDVEYPWFYSGLQISYHRREGDYGVFDIEVRSYSEGKEIVNHLGIVNKGQDHYMNIEFEEFDTAKDLFSFKVTLGHTNAFNEVCSTGVIKKENKFGFAFKN